MVSKKRRERNGSSSQQKERESKDDGKLSQTVEYEQSREQRIKENLQRMEKLGILDLSRNLKPTTTTKPRPSKPSQPLPPSRRSSRLKTRTPVSYVEKRIPNKVEKVMKNVKIDIKEGSKPEVYTEEDEKLLGDCKATWTLYVDGYDEEGQRIYDPYEGKSCHQCRQKTLGLHTECSKCQLVQGQFCGDCLYMRYGENVIEANENTDWVCPTCRGICNCSRCRRAKGWEPTSNIYRKALYLGFKSVAHYLIQTRGSHANREAASDETSLPPADTKADISGGNLVSQLDDKEDNTEEDSKHHVLAKNDSKHSDHNGQYKRDLDPDYNCDPVNEDNVDEEDEDDVNDSNYLSEEN